jgi:hypothetical protein
LRSDELRQDYFFSGGAGTTINIIENKFNSKLVFKCLNKW